MGIISGAISAEVTFPFFLRQIYTVAESFVEGSAMNKSSFSLVGNWNDWGIAIDLVK